MIRTNDGLHTEAHEAFWELCRAHGKARDAHEVITECQYPHDDTFLGFLGDYYALSLIVPTDRVIYDLGCASGFQSIFFAQHHAYIGVDTNRERRFYGGDKVHHISTDIRSFIEDPRMAVDRVHFAICNAVPLLGDDHALVRRTFTDLHVCYPNAREPLIRLRRPRPEAVA